MTEGITNGGFETGDFTGWTCSDGVVVSSNPHAGTYCAEVYPSGTRLLYQVLATPIAVDDINSFTFWYKDSSSTTFKVVYTDETDTGWLSMSNESSWTEKDVLAELTSGKTVKEIHILNGYVQPVHIDDVSITYFASVGVGNADIGNIFCYIIEWKEEQKWDVGIKDVAMRTEGQYLDTGAKVINPKQITITIRLSSTEKTSLQTLIDGNTTTTFATSDGIWSYVVWILTKNLAWKYIEKAGDARPWETRLKLLVVSGGKV